MTKLTQTAEAILNDQPNEAICQRNPDVQTGIWIRDLVCSTGLHPEAAAVLPAGSSKDGTRYPHQVMVRYTPVR